MMQKDEKLSYAQDSFKSFSYDLEAVLYTPKCDVGELYYSRKFSVYNFTIFEDCTKNGYSYVWDEAEGKRGSCEIGTGLVNYIKSLPSEVKITFHQRNILHITSTSIC